MNIKKYIVQHLNEKMFSTNLPSLYVIISIRFVRELFLFCKLETIVINTQKKQKNPPN